MCWGQDPPLSSGLMSLRQMFSVNNYYAVTYVFQEASPKMGTNPVTTTR